MAIIGANGAGKTTLLNLLLRFYEPNEGSISFGETDIRHIKLNNYRTLFSVVSQDPYLFNTTIEKNIDLKHGKRCSVIEACQKSGAETFVKRLDKSYQTVVGRNGAKLSGGEKQKVAVARVFINNAPIIIFDEATSNFDSFSDDYLNQVIFSQLNTKTVIIITHKSGILKYMDKVFEIKEGIVTEKVNEKSNKTRYQKANPW